MNFQDDDVRDEARDETQPNRIIGDPSSVRNRVALLKVF